MVFSSISFLFAFLPSILFFYFIISKRQISKNLTLLIFSFVFYSWGGLRPLPIILYAIITNYWFGRKVTDKNSKKFWLTAAIISNIGVLFFFKYIGFFVENLKLIFPSIPSVNIALPIGISFYTFQGLSYVIDVYRQDVKCENNIANVALYIVLFPQLVAGPIVRYSTVASEIQRRSTSLQEISSGFQRLLFGLGKKVLIANQVGQLADSVFKQQELYLSTGLVWLGILAYSAQIYFDFSGYSDMAIGLGRIFGFHFLENFEYPYISKSITEFWRRWHISLSSWFRDYLYIPLGGNRLGYKVQIRNLIIVWVLTGLWHGASWNFVIWGIYYGVLLLVEKFLIGIKLARFPSCVRHFYALFFIMCGWLIFRATDISQIATLFKAMMGFAKDGFWNNQATYLLLEYRWDLMVAILFSMPIYPALKQFIKQNSSKSDSLFWEWGKEIVALLIGALSVMRLLASDFNPFIYFQF